MRPCTPSIVLGVALLAIGTLCAEPLPKDIVNGEGVLLRLDQVEMDQVVDLYSRITDKVVLPAPEVKGKVTIINRHRVSPAEAARLLESALELQGWSVIPQGKIVKLVKSKDAVKRLLPTLVPRTNGDLENTNRMQTHLVPLRYAKGEDVKSLISPLLSNDGTIQYNQRTNLLVVTEVGTNMARLFELIEKVDRPLNTEEEYVDSTQLRFVDPKKMVEDIKEYFKSSAISFLPNERLGVLVINGRREDVIRARQIVEQLDRPVDPEQTVNQIIRIRYAKAADVAELILKLYKSRIDPVPPSFSINSDKPSNTLIITGPQELRSEIARLVLQIDQRYDQVLLKALVGEVNVKPTRTLGVQWQYLRNATDVAQNYGTVYPSSDMTPLRTSVLGVRYGVIHPTGYSHFINTLETSQSFSVLASPQIAVATNKTATFKVTDQVPIQTAERFSDNSNVMVKSSEYKEVGLTMKVVPSITPNHELSLDLDFTFSELGPRDEILQNPIIATRQTQTSVIVADEHTLVIAGLLRKDHDRSESRVPWIGRMPIVGPLFRNRHDENGKQELLVLLTPTIMNAISEADRVAHAYQGVAFENGSHPSFPHSVREMSKRLTKLTKLDADDHTSRGTQWDSLPGLDKIANPYRPLPPPPDLDPAPGGGAAASDRVGSRSAAGSARGPAPGGEAGPFAVGRDRAEISLGDEPVVHIRRPPPVVTFRPGKTAARAARAIAPSAETGVLEPTHAAPPAPVQPVSAEAETPTGASAPPGAGGPEGPGMVTPPAQEAAGAGDAAAGAAQETQNTERLRATVRELLQRLKSPAKGTTRAASDGAASGARM